MQARHGPPIAGSLVSRGFLGLHTVEMNPATACDSCELSMIAASSAGGAFQCSQGVLTQILRMSLCPACFYAFFQTAMATTLPVIQGFNIKRQLVLAQYCHWQLPAQPDYGVKRILGSHPWRCA